MAELAFDSIQRGTVSWDTTDYLKTVELTTPVDASKSILLFDASIGNSGRPDTSCVFGQLDSDGEGLTFKRGGDGQGQNRAVVLDWQVVTFESGVTVTRYSGTGGFNTPIAIGRTVKYSKTWAILSYHFTGGGTSFDANETACVALIDAGDDEATTFQILFNGSGTAPNNMNWAVQIIEFDEDSGAEVQHVVTAQSGGQSTEITLGTAVDTTRTMVIGSSYSTGTASSQGINQGLYHDWAENGAKLLLKKEGTNDTNVASVFVVTWPDHVKVFRYASTLPLSGESTIEESITDIGDWSKALVFTQGGRQNFGQPGNNASSALTTQYLTTRPGSDTTKVAIQRLGTSFGLNSPNCVFQVIAFGDEIGEPSFAWPGDVIEGLKLMAPGQWHCPELAPANAATTVHWQDVRIPNILAPSDNAHSIFEAWPSMVFDTSRNENVHYGGGHGNNCKNNELYVFNWDLAQWSRLCRPSHTIQYTSVGDYWGSVGGEDDAPCSAHTYANTGYLPLTDAYITFGGAATDTGGRYRALDGGNAGPYLYDLTKRDPDKVGGADGTGHYNGAVDEASEGLYAWFNAYDATFAASSTASSPQDWTSQGAEGSVDVRVEDGKEVIYIGKFNRFTKIIVNDPYDWSVNTLEDEIYQSSSSGFQQSAFIHSIQLMFWCLDGTTTELDRFYAFAMNGTKSTRLNITVADPDGVVGDLSTNLSHYSYVWDEVRDRVLGFNRYGQVIAIYHSNVTPNGSNDTEVTSGWYLELIDVGWDEDYRQMLSSSAASRYGMTKYVRKIDAVVKTEFYSTESKPYAWIWKPERDWSPLGIANGIATAPEVGAPAVGQNHAFTADAVVIPPAVAGVDMAQGHALVGNGLAAGPVVGDADIGQHHALAVDGIATAPAAGLVDISTEGSHTLVADGLVAAAAAGVAEINQGHALEAGGITTGPVVGLVDISAEGSHTLGVEGLAATPVVGDADIGQHHALEAEGIATAPAAGSVALTQTHALSAAGIATTPVVLPASLASDGQHVLEAAGLVVGVETARALVGQIHALATSGIVVAPEVGLAAVNITLPPPGRVVAAHPINRILTARS